MQSNPIDFDDTKTAFAQKSDLELQKSNLIFTALANPWLVRVGTLVTNYALKANLPVKRIIKRTMFDQFCGGEFIADCSKTIRLLGEKNVQTILDYSVEGLKNEDGYDEVKNEAIRVLDYASDNQNITFCVLKLSGLGSTDLMMKLQNKEDLSEIEKTKLHYCEQRVDAIIAVAVKKNLRVMLDAEESWIQCFIDSVAYRMMEKYNHSYPVVYNTYQLYRHDVLGRMERAILKAEAEGYFLGAKVVRGAYMEKEREKAAEQNYPSPIHRTKESVDQDYDNALKLCLSHIEHVGICAGTHNEDSANLLTQLIAAYNLQPNDKRIYFAQLLGMSDNISFKLADMGYNVGKYVPYGPVKKVLPYLFRRAKENTSIAGQSGRQLSLIRKELKRRKKEKQ